MQMESEINLMVDEYINVEFELDVDRLAEELATDHNFVDDTVLHAHVEEYCDSYVADRVSERVDEEIQELREQIRELQPDNNYVRINDLREVIDAQITHRVAQILSDVMKGIEERRKENQ
jgi:hypothetical protein